mgnify:CR=1 FL=1
MNKVKRRAMSALLVAVLVLGGIGVYIVRYIEHGAEWATFAANSSVYTSGVLSTGTLTDRNGVVLATANGGSRSYAEDAAVRTACYQAVGDYTGNVGTGALKAFSKQLSGYNPITGTYATDGHTVALTLDSSLCVTAYEALAGRKGAVLVSNYKTGELLCMVSGPSIDPNSDGDVPDGAYINRCINGSFTPGSIFKLITSAAAIENIKDIDSRRFSCAGSLDVNGVSVKCTAVHGSQTSEDALANSCNCAFAQISLDLGADTIETHAKKFAFPGVTVKVIEDKAEMNPQNLAKLEKESGAGRVVIEYNGMWLLQELADALPENWLVYQCIATADGTTALTYARDNSMRSLLLDKIARSELIVFNRAEAVNNDEARQELHKLVRQASRKCDIAYEFADGSVAYDDIPDPLPFDVNAPVIDIHDDDFGIWYMDCQDEPQKYTGKTVKFLAQVCQTNRAGKNSFVPGRFAMTCCVQDIQFVGFPCSYDGYKALEQRSWVRVTAKVSYKFHNIYRGKGPVLTAISVEPAEKPLNEVVTFS